MRKTSIVLALDNPHAGQAGVTERLRMERNAILRGLVPRMKPGTDDRRTRASRFSMLEGEGNT
jgi:hypothetical protein